MFGRQTLMKHAGECTCEWVYMHTYVALNNLGGLGEHVTCHVFVS